MKTYKNDKGVKVEQKVNAQLHEAWEGTKKDDPNTVNVKIEIGVLGNKQGEIKTGDSSKRSSKSIATGSSLLTGLKSGYVTGKWTVPFFFNYVNDNVSKIVPIVASIQNKLSGILRGAQGKVDGNLAKKLRDTAIRSEAIQMAKERIMSRTSSEFDQKSFEAANSLVRANVLTDMSMSAMVEINFSIANNGQDLASWAEQKGYKESVDGDYLVMHAKEKGLKKVYLHSAQLVSDAQDKVDEVCSKIESKYKDFKAFSSLGADNSLEALQLIDTCLDYEPSTLDDVLFEEFSEDELRVIDNYVNDIIDRYDAHGSTL